MLEITYDDGWNTEFIPGCVPMGYRQLSEKLLKYGLVSYYARNTYIYMAASNTWSVFVSSEAQKQICSIVGSDNASVNYLAASLPYINYLQKHALRASSMPISVCIGTRRLAVYLDESSKTIRLEPCKSIVTVLNDVDTRVGELCIMPCMYERYPSIWQLEKPCSVYKFLQVLFLNSLELTTVCWILGNIAIDPATSSKFLLLYGPGGAGKSTLISIIEDLFKGCCGTIKSNTFTDLKHDISVDTAKTIASNRVLTAGDIDLQTKTLNLHVVKELTGHDSIAVPPLKVATRCSIVAACNDLPSVKKQPTWTSSAISRRTVVSVMNVKTASLPKIRVPDTEYDNLDFLMHCIYTNLSYPTMPISTRCLMYTLLGNEYNSIRDKIKETDDVSESEIVDANVNIEIHFGIPSRTLGELANLVSPTTVIEIGSIYFVKGIKLIEELTIDS